MTTILVTGGAGYLGSRLVPALASTGRTVIVVDPLLYGQEPPGEWAGDARITLLRQGSEALEADDLVGIDEIIDFAAISNESIAQDLPELTWKVNAAGRTRLAEMAARAGLRRYILPSSSNVYGPGTAPHAESDTIEPSTTYCLANADAERSALALASNRFHPLVLRQATVYGFAPVMRYDLVVNAIVADAVLNGKCSVMGDGTQVRPFVWIGDLVESYLAMLRRPAEELGGRIVNLGSTADQFAVKHIPEALGRVLGGTVPYTFYGELDRLSHRLDCSTLERYLGRSLGPSLERAIVELLGRIREEPDRVARDRAQRSDFVARYRDRNAADG